MSIAVGMIETLGFPAVVEAADAMVKAARVTLVGYEKLVVVGSQSLFAVTCPRFRLQSRQGLRTSSGSTGVKSSRPISLPVPTRTWNLCCRFATPKPSNSSVKAYLVSGPMAGKPC